MERIEFSSLYDNRILSDQQMQNIFGGRKDVSVIRVGPYTRDEWYDNNNNGKLDKGDVIVLSKTAVPGDTDVEMTPEEIESSEAEVLYE